MSRHTARVWEFNGKRGHFNLVYGWDRPLASYFIQVFNMDANPDNDEDHLLLNIGCELTEGEDGKLVELSYRDIDSLQARFTEEASATLGESICNQLVHDKEVEGMGLTQFQINMMNMFDEAANVTRQPRE